MRTRAWLSSVAGVYVAVVVVAACVGDEPVGEVPSTTDAGDGGGVITPGNDSGGVPGTDGGADPTMDAGPDVTAAPRYCETVSKPLAPAEFFCADFDGPDASSGWTTSFQPDGGTLELTTDVFFSAPQSLVVHPPNGPGAGGPFLEWTSVSGKKFQKAELRARMNPSEVGGTTAPYMGSIKLLEITTTNALVALYYTDGGSLVQSDPAQDNYLGYYIKSAAFGGAATQKDYAITTMIEPKLWTDVSLSWQASGPTVLKFNNIPVFTMSLFGSSDTSVTFRVGAASTGAVNELKRMRYDNIEVTLDREQ